MAFVAHSLVFAALLGLTAGCFPSYDHLGGDTHDSSEDTPAADTVPVDTHSPDTAEQVSDSSVDTADPVDSADTGPPPDGTSGGDVVVTPECGSPADCPLTGPCARARCDDGTCGVEHTTGTCDDGDACTTQDICVDGECVGRAWTSAESTGWLASFDGAGTAMANALVVHPSGDVSVVGSFEGTATLAGTSRTARGDADHPDAFIARFGPSGAVKWVAQAGGDGLDAALYAAGDGEGLLAAGWFSGTATFGVGANEVSVTAAGELGQSFIASYGPTGGLVRVWRFPGFIRALAVAEDGSGDLIVAGLFREQAVFAGLGGPITIAAVGGLDAYVARLTAAGEARWVGRVGSAGDEGAAELVPIQVVARAGGGVTLVVDIAGAPAGYRVGDTTTSLGVVVEAGIGFAQVRLDLDATGGVAAVTVLGSLPTFRFVSGALATDGSVVLSGGEIGLTANGEPDPEGAPPRLFVERVDADGAVAWSKQIAGSGAFIGSVPLLAYVARSIHDEVVVLGSFDGGDVAFDYGTPLSPAVSSDGPGPRLFVARYDLDGKSLGGVSSPAGGGVPIADWVYKVGLQSFGAPTAVAPKPGLSSDGAACVAVPQLRPELQAVLLPGHPWLGSHLTLERSVGAAYCIAAARILGCAIQE